MEPLLESRIKLSSSKIEESIYLFPLHFIPFIHTQLVKENMSHDIQRKTCQIYYTGLRCSSKHVSMQYQALCPDYYEIS